jgi:hypothetical protein
MEALVLFGVQKIKSRGPNNVSYLDDEICVV